MGNETKADREQDVVKTTQQQWLNALEEAIGAAAASSAGSEGGGGIEQNLVMSFGP